MAYRQAIGRQGEELAAAYLESRGMRVIERNFRVQGGEIDLIAEDGRYLAFVEVKTRRGGAFGRPREAVDVRKQAHLICAARAYLARFPSPPFCRFDVVEVLWQGEKPRIVHIPNAFECKE